MEAIQHKKEFRLSEQEIADLCTQYRHLDDPKLIIEAVNSCFSFRHNEAKVRTIHAIFNSNGFCQCDKHGLKMLASHMQRVCTRLLNEGRYKDYTFSISLNGKIRCLIHHLESKSFHNPKSFNDVN